MSGARKIRTLSVHVAALIVGGGALALWALLSLKKPGGPPFPDAARRAAPEQDTRGPTSPAFSHRRAQLQQALAGLGFDSGVVEPAPGWQQILAQAPVEPAGALREQGRQLLQGNQPIAAIENFKLAILRDPQDPGQYDGLGRALVYKSKTIEAVASFRTALRLDPSLVETRFELGLTHQRRAEFPQAIDQWRELLTWNPNHTEAHERLAIVLYYTHDYAEAWKHVHAAERLGHQVPPQFRPLLEAQMAEPPE